MNLDLTQKTAFVCGSTSGLGKASALEMALLGANIVLIARNEDKLKSVLKELDVSKNQKHNYIVADFSQVDVLKIKLDTFLLENPTVHILVNNTGGPSAGAILDANLEEFNQAFSNHLLCNQVLVQAVAPSMKSAGFGRIINIVGTAVKEPVTGLGVSNTIRAAVANWGKTLAGELGPFGITVNNVLPGLTKTARLESVLNEKSIQNNVSRATIDKTVATNIPVGRFGEPKEFGAVIAFLASPVAGYINGINLPVDGGMLGSL
ncbi:3-oxoacyl-[acyl-carrier protein] reductase [Gillisia sp. Hel1_33_143]|uniref:SDR family oxidoreductase n=1 Tax=Gillisia sp. Hel1_33_143 TaxID=1336796 RepID=UPI00087C8943|nr:SDR family oxidoreductase [Gillisia sp. Hel1_33_143]SDR99625.1 3-oxoacyl-[acyl-carrier protein] reductase [Gillisia sp. Hel1_33_143]